MKTIPLLLKCIKKARILFPQVMAMNESFDGKLEDNIRVKQHKITGFTSEDQERRTS